MAFKLLVIALASALVSAQGPVQCDDMRVRRSAHSLTDSDWQNIQNVVSQLHLDGQFGRFARTHDAVFDNVHGHSAFFPFHRRFVLEFENLGRKIDPSFTIPYWDTTRDYRTPQSSPVLRGAALGGNGEGPQGCLQSGIQGNWTLGFPNRHCLSRRFSGGDGTILPWVPAELISSFIQRDGQLSDFREHIEFSIHGATHIGLGGDAGTRYAPNDFFFYMHHANIDRLWWQWQNSQGRLFEYNGPGTHGEAQLADVIPEDQAVSFGGQAVGSVMILGFNGVCYYYDSAPNPPSRYPGASSDDNGRMKITPVLNATASFSGSSNVASHELEMAGIHRALGEQAGLKEFFPKVALLGPSRMEIYRPNDKCGGYKKAKQALVYPARMNKDWVKMHGFVPERVEKVYRDACRLIDLLNNSTYVSPY
ncbi:hypothetical protein GGH94_004098 [Coemansia aciculifera]|uniref:Tyrosinase copper-binding domain-containing protein n=1 Tax=Coemansia aciculifera TaxID=417176 RepID=A0A9W8IG38_9FUNG|nr:hypothetical protein GGH94_004098 [Coemansia aciculifera]KAJ2872942.1 hypothetical protein GGH93_003611 [Coemansia aciculifera]